MSGAVTVGGPGVLNDPLIERGRWYRGGMLVCPYCGGKGADGLFADVPGDEVYRVADLEPADRPDDQLDLIAVEISGEDLLKTIWLKECPGCERLFLGPENKKGD